MVLLRQCETGWGASRIVETNPSTSVYEGLFYLPFAPDQTWGLFNSSGDIIRDSVDFRDTQGETNAQLLTTDLTADSVDQFAPHAHYIYGGRIHLHYGHFIVNTLSRFWSIKNLFVPGSKVVCHGPGTVEDWFQFPFFVDSMAAIGLTADDFVMFQSPVRIDKVIIPRTSFEEQKSAHRVYKGFCADIGKTMYEPSEIDVAAQPIYFSKTRLSAGVGTFVNEIEFETVLKRKGVKVIYPETLSFREQVQLIARHRTITGTAGSFLHTSIFGPSNRKMIVLNPTDQANSNFLIIDKLNHNDALYLYSDNIEVLPSGPDDQFLTSRYIVDAESVAEEFLTLMIPHA